MLLAAPDCGVARPFGAQPIQLCLFCHPADFHGPFHPLLRNDFRSSDGLRNGK